MCECAALPAERNVKAMDITRGISVFIVPFEAITFLLNIHFLIYLRFWDFF